jgi:hypothetical protein
MTSLQNTSNVQKTVHASTKVANVWNYGLYLQLAAPFFCLFCPTIFYAPASLDKSGLSASFL